MPSVLRSVPEDIEEHSSRARWWRSRQKKNDRGKAFPLWKLYYGRTANARKCASAVAAKVSVSICLTVCRGIDSLSYIQRL